ncbi:MAG: class I adenylate-forming enzyme family protein [Candidatus Saccharibacteria bacterium]|nr:class I adenylate-forming enzyme family protein [Candidatus Saccharibacteria bacterium]
MFEFIFRKIKRAVRAIDMKIERSKYGYIEKLPKEIQYFEGGMYDAIYEASCKWPHNIAIDYFNTSITYRELVKKINRVAAALKGLGADRGDRITVCMPNTPEAVYMFYAINEIGAVANMIHPLSSEKEIEDYLKRSHSKFMLCIDLAYPKVKSIMKDTELEYVIVVSVTHSMNFTTRLAYYLTKGRRNYPRRNKKVLTWDKFLNRADNFIGNPHARINSNDLAVILYSGGTTGKPKGVMLSNANFNTQALGARYLVPELLKSRYSMLTFLPNFHAFGLGICTHIPLYCGMRVVLIPQFNAKKFKKYLLKYKINIIVGVPTVFEYFVKLKFGKKDLRFVKGVVSGGDMISQALKQEVNTLLRTHGSKAVLENGYGLTEATGGMVFSTVNVASDRGVIGFPLPDSEVIICDPKTNQPLPIGQSGEILVRGHTIMRGYLNDKKETEAAFTKIKNKKFLKTGDIGYLDERGAVYFKGRLKRMIITNGYNVYPSNVEEVTLKSKLVESCACIGVPDNLRGESVKIFIVPKENASERAIKKDLNKIYRQYLAKFETPRIISFTDSLPKTKLGKIDFIALKDYS